MIYNPQKLESNPAERMEIGNPTKLECVAGCALSSCAGNCTRTPPWITTEWKEKLAWVHAIDLMYKYVCRRACLWTGHSFPLQFVQQAVHVFHFSMFDSSTLYSAIFWIGVQLRSISCWSTSDAGFSIEYFASLCLLIIPYIQLLHSISALGNTDHGRVISNSSSQLFGGEIISMWSDWCLWVRAALHIFIGFQLSLRNDELVNEFRNLYSSI